MRRKKALFFLLTAALAVQLLCLPALAVSNQEQIWVYLRGQGFSQPAAAGIMGNLESESSYLPNNLENTVNKKTGLTDEEFTALVDDGTITREEFARSDEYGVYANKMYGYGLAGWTWYTYKEELYDLARERGTSIGDLNTQLEFLVKTAMRMKKLEDFKDSTDVAAATILFHNVYENSSSTQAMIMKRVERAQAVFDKFGDATVLFPRPAVYTAGRFTDVSPREWYAPSVADAYELGLMTGTTATEFDPMGNVTLAQAVTMAARIHSIYQTGAEHFTQTGIWYQVYLDYAEKNGIIPKGAYSGSLDKEATRAQFAEIFAKALPADGLISINTVEDDTIPDVKTGDSIGPAVYKLYRAGILTGSDAAGTFYPGRSITRGEAAAIVARMGDSSVRKGITLKAPEPTDEAGME